MSTNEQQQTIEVRRKSEPKKPFQNNPVNRLHLFSDKLTLSNIYGVDPMTTEQKQRESAVIVALAAVGYHVNLKPVDGAILRVIEAA